MSLRRSYGSHRDKGCSSDYDLGGPQQLGTGRLKIEKKKDIRSIFIIRMYISSIYREGFVNMMYKKLRWQNMDLC
jgi:hypothetical protein